MKHFSLLNAIAVQVPFEKSTHDHQSEAEHITKEMGLDQRPLSSDAQTHYLQNRFRCRSCMICVVFSFSQGSLLSCVGLAAFCLSCHVTPYHLGFSCDEYGRDSSCFLLICDALHRYQQYLRSPKCRFCSVGVMERNRMKDPPSPALADVKFIPLRAILADFLGFAT